MPQYVTEDEERISRQKVLLTLAAIAIAITLRILPPEPQQRIAGFFTNTVLFPFVLVQEGLTSSRIHAATTEDLQTAIDSLTQELVNQRGLVEENASLRRILGLGPRLGNSFLPTNIIRSGTSMSGSVFALDAGSLRGVREDASVITGMGLLGVVSSVERDRSSAIDWTHPDFSASAMTEDGTVFGFVRAERSEFREADRLRMDGVPFQQELSAGTPIVTSGRGGVHPRGVPLGTVIEEAETVGGVGWRRSYWLSPAVDPGEAVHALVLVTTGDSIPAFTSPWLAADTLASDSTAVGPGGGR